MDLNRINTRVYAMTFLHHHHHLHLISGPVLILLCSRVTAIRVIGRSVTVTAGEDATLFCQLVDSKEKLTRITWQKKTRGTLVNKDFFVITSDGKTENKNRLGDRVQFIGNIKETIGTILLKSVTLLDEGVYTCVINIFPSGPFEAASDLNVQVSPVVSVTTDVIPVVGESEVTMATCTATAKPEADVSWDLGALSDSVKVKNIYSEDSNGTSTVKSYLIGVPSKDLNQQKVQCLVKHTSLNEEVILDHALVIHYPPQDVYIISSNNKDQTKFQEFQCVVDANPQPTVFTWSRVNKSLPGHADGSRLTVPQTSDSNGLYLCNVSNQYGNGTDTLYFHHVTASSPVCWILFTILLTVLLGIGVYLVWKFKSTGGLNTFISSLRERNGHFPVSTSSPSRAERRNHTEDSECGSL